MKRTFPAIAILALISLLAIAGCGSGDSSSGNSSNSGGPYGESSNEATKAASTAGGGPAIVSASTTPELGKVIVDSKGFTLYNFHKDKGGTPSCYGPCAKAWPPLITEGKPQVGEGAMGSKLGTTERKDGTTQVTYAGWPVYTFAEDRKPGETNGNDVDAFGAEWYALQPNGEEPKD